MKHQVATLEGAFLDYAVALAEKLPCACIIGDRCEAAQLVAAGTKMVVMRFNPSTDWFKGGPLLEKYDIHTGGYGSNRQAEIRDDPKPWVSAWGPTLLVAGMRALVEWKLGKEIELP